VSTMQLPWRKLIANPSTTFARLPLITRGVADEILRLVDDEGRIDLRESKPKLSLMLLMGVHPRERRRVLEAIDELELEGLIAFDGGTLQLRTTDSELTVKRPRTDRETTANVRRNDRERTPALREVEPKAAQPLNSAPGEQSRAEEEQSREEENTDPGSDAAPPEPVSVAPEIRSVFEHWCAVFAKPPNTKLTKDRAAKVRARLRDGYTADALKQAIDGCSKSDWHLGANDRQTPFTDLVTICKSPAAVDSHSARLTGSGVRQMPKGVAPARKHEEFNDDDPDEIWGPKAGAAE